MSDEIILSLDAMGGELAPGSVIEGAERARRREENVRFLFHGQEPLIHDALRQFPELRKISAIRHTDAVVEMTDKPSQTLRRARQSSMWRALEAVKKGEAHAAISGGNTGMLMAMSKIIFKTLEGVNRPAIAGLWPSASGKKNVVLDLGATINPGAKQLVQFAFMGDVCARILLGAKEPRIGLLNIGVEEIKGTENVRAAAEILQKSQDISFQGFVEGDALGHDIVDVIVADGFSGNIALKAAEGTARQIAAYLQDAFSQSLLARLGYLFLRPALRAFRDQIDPRHFNGGVFLGVRGLALKSHGGSDEVGFAFAIHSAVQCARARLIERLAEKLAHLPALLQETGGAGSASGAGGAKTPLPESEAIL